MNWKSNFVSCKSIGMHRDNESYTRGWRNNFEHVCSKYK